LLTLPLWIKKPYTYTGREFDYDTGLYYYRARYYDPKAGRFMTKDPLSFEGGDTNLYNYVLNNPVNYIDPEGLEIWTCNRKTTFGVGNHAYLWNDKDNSCCGTGSTTKCKEKGPKGGDSCRVIMGSRGRENEVMKCCRTTGDYGAWIPGVHDCHNTSEDCTKSKGLQYPGAPGGRFGKPCDPCKK